MILEDVWGEEVFGFRSGIWVEVEDFGVICCKESFYVNEVWDGCLCESDG